MPSRHMTSKLRPLTVVIAVLAIQSLVRAGDLAETCRVRVTNSVDGTVQVSLDKGKSYLTVGRVTRPATRCTDGFAASAYAEAGRITATAVHALRVKSPSSSGTPQVFSIIPREFAVPGVGFGTGEVAGASGIYTDIPAGTAIFRNLSPLVGNPVLIEKDGGLQILPLNYRPSPGDILVILVEVHEDRPDELVIENREGGSVEAVYPDHSEVIASVEQPVSGVGRFDATEYTGVGCVNTNHPGCITISTAPVLGNGKGVTEPRGGFQILPSRHASRIGSIPQYMVVRPASPDAPPLEGLPLLFSEYIGLASDPVSLANSFRVDIRVGTGDWQPLPSMLGKDDHALTDLSGGGVMYIRLRFPDRSGKWLEHQLEIASDDYLRRRYGGRPTSGVLTVSLQGSDLTEVRLASLSVDGQFRGLSTAWPYTFSIDTAKLPEGEHSLEIRGVDDTGVMVKSSRTLFYTVGANP